MAAISVDFAAANITPLNNTSSKKPTSQEEINRLSNSNKKTLLSKATVVSRTLNPVTKKKRTTGSATIAAARNHRNKDFVLGLCSPTLCASRPAMRQSGTRLNAIRNNTDLENIRSYENASSSTISQLKNELIKRIRLRKPSTISKERISLIKRQPR